MADFDYIESTGVILPDTETLLVDAEQEFRDALGQGLSVDPETPQGVLIGARVSLRRAVLEVCAAVANQFNPDLATGQYLDALASLSGLSRVQSTFSTIASVTVSGVSGTDIPAGRRARSTAGDEWQTSSPVRIGPDGSATVDFVAVEAGPIGCGVGELDTIVDFVLGWESVDNSNSAVVGRLSQSDAAFRQLRNRTLGLQGTGLVESIVSAVNAIDGVQSLSFLENVDDSEQTIEGVTLVPHSIWMCVNGGESQDIADTLRKKKSFGCNWNGSTEVVSTDPFSNQAYTVKFDRPAQIAIAAKVTVKPGTYTGDPQTAVKAAIVDYADGNLENERGFVVGGSVSPFELSAAVNSQLPGIYVRKVEIAYVSSGVFVTVELPIEIDEIATITESSITVIEE